MGALAILDPEDEEQVERLIAVYLAEGRALGYSTTTTERVKPEHRLSSMQAALRSLAVEAPAHEATTLATITALTTAALAEHRRGCPTYGLVSARQINDLIEEANHG